jgi:acetyl-CoA C-acetyltransferase
MREVAIVSPVRTAVGNFLGGLKDISAAELGATVIKAVLERTGLEPDKIDEVILGQGYPSGEEPAIGRLCALKAGLPIEVPGYQLDRRCSSGLQSILNACMMEQTGNADVVLAGGVESMSRVEFYTTDMRSGSRLGSVTLHDRLTRARATASPEERFGVISGMIETAENVAARDRMAREAQDAYALRRHQCAVAALESGTCADEIVPVLIPQRRGAPIRFQVDEGPRKETSLEALATLRPLTSGGSVTAGNASAQNDAASVCLVVAGDQLDALGLQPMAFRRGWAVAGVHPAYMGMGSVPAVAKALARTGLTWDDIDLIELNEAFAAQVLAVLKDWKLERWDTLNVNGSGISLGHPIAATGARILTTLLHEMQRREARYGLETMCVGGGQGVAAIFERR